MLNFLSILLIFLILLFLLISKRKLLIRMLTKNRNNLIGQSKILGSQKKLNSKLNGNYKFTKALELERSHNKLKLRKDMFRLFQGNKADKLKSLEIASLLSDKSTLKILKIGLKDMDPEIVELSARLITKFK